jgi:predicted nucleic acid-binding protein
MERKYKESRPKLPHLEDDKVKVMRMCMTRMEGCPLQLVTMSTLVLAEAIVHKYKFRMFDAIVVASNLEAGCTTLYTEDMSHKQLIYKQLRIINPFLDD